MQCLRVSFRAVRPLTRTVVSRSPPSSFSYEQRLQSRTMLILVPCKFHEATFVGLAKRFVRKYEKKKPHEYMKLLSVLAMTVGCIDGMTQMSLFEGGMHGVKAKVFTDPEMTRARVVLKCFGYILADGRAKLQDAFNFVDEEENKGEKEHVEPAKQVRVELDPVFETYLRHRGVALERILQDEAKRYIVVRAKIRFLGVRDVHLSYVGEFTEQNCHI